MGRPLKARLFGLALTGAALGACAGGASSYPTVAWVPEGAERIVINAAALADAKSEHVMFVDSWQREDYAVFRSPTAQAEFIYADADDFKDVALDSEVTLEQSIRSWKFNEAHPKQFGEIWGMEGPLGTTHYLPYALTDIGWSCVATMSEWDKVSEDPYYRPDKILFGYFCDKSGRQLTLAEVSAVVASVGVRGITEAIEPQRVGLSLASAANDATTETAGAEAFAHGAAGNAGAGNSRYPFNFARHYNVADGDGRDN